MSTGIKAMDIDMEGGCRRPGESQGGRLFTLAARTGVGKTVLGVWAAANLAFGGLTVGFISAELQMDAIVARLAAAATKLADPTQTTRTGPLSERSTLPTTTVRRPVPASWVQPVLCSRMAASFWSKTPGVPAMTM